MAIAQWLLVASIFTRQLIRRHYIIWQIICFGAYCISNITSIYIKVYISTFGMRKLTLGNLHDESLRNAALPRSLLR
jgi:hypothetical protein